MPTNRRRRLVRRGSYSTSPRILELLSSGHDFPFIDLALGETLDPDAIAQAWEELGDELLANHVARLPGTRPHAWWVYQRPDLLQVIGFPSEYEPLKQRELLRTHGLLTAEEQANL
jgi:hypothetical protein